MFYCLDAPCVSSDDHDRVVQVFYCCELALTVHQGWGIPLLQLSRYKI